MDKDGESTLSGFCIVRKQYSNNGSDSGLDLRCYQM